MKNLLPFFMGMCMLFAAPLAKAQDEPENPLPKLQPLVEAWNSAISNNQVDNLLALYAEQAKCYGKRSSKAEIVASKKAWLAKNTGYKQEVNDFIVREYEGMVEVAFEKVMIQGEKRSTVQGYLLFDPETHKIVGESDRKTDTNLAKKVVALAPPQGKGCYSNSGGIWPPVAVPTYYSLDYELDIQGKAVVGEGSYYSWASRMMWGITIKGVVLSDNSLSLEVRMEGPLYPDDPGNLYEYREIRKWDGKSMVWGGGEETEYLYLQEQDCE